MSDLTRLLIEKKTAGNYGLAALKWTQQLEATRALPEVQR